MARQSFEEKLARLKRLADEPCSEETVCEIRRALSGANSILAAAASRASVKLNLRDMIPELVSVYGRYLKNPVKTDPGCHAKIAAVEALTELDYPEADIFLQGIRYIQMEPSYGPPVDTADHLRAACAFGLYHLGHPELPFEMVSLLTDKEPVAKRAAIKVLTELGQEWCELLLCMKVLQGDAVPEILGDCFNGLMSMTPDRSLQFIARFLESDDSGVAEEAALAIGNSRLPKAYTLLCDCRNGSADSAFKRMLLLPVALTRCEDAFNLLLNVIGNEPPDYAVAAIQALAVYGDAPERRKRIQETARMRKESTISEEYERLFG